MLSHSVMSNSFAIPWTVAHQAPLSIFQARILEMGCHFLLQGIFPNPGIQSVSPALQVDSLPLSHQGSPYP